jgi:hypothetical protein
MSIKKTYRKNLASGFGSKKVGSFWLIGPFFEFDAAHRAKKMAKSGQIVDLFGRNASD